MTYVCHDTYLKDSGTLGFVITQSIFKTKGGGDGFRGLRYSPIGSSQQFFAPVEVEDLATIQAFEAQQIALRSSSRGKANSSHQYPVPYVRWIKDKKAKILSKVLTEEFLSKVERRIQAATPVDKDDLRSLVDSWISRKFLKSSRVSSITVGYESRKGVYCPTNTIYWIEKWQKGPANTTIITNLADSGKRRSRK